MRRGLRSSGSARRRGLLIAVLWLGAALAAGAQQVRVLVDGSPLALDQPAMMVSGRVLVPLRGIFEALGAEVLYEPAQRSIKATRGTTVVELTLDSQTARINGAPQYLDVPARSYGGRTMVPLRFVSQALGADVKWHGASRTVAIQRSGQGSGWVPPPPPPPPPQGDRPVITGLAHDARGTLSAGARVHVVLTGDPGGEAWLDISGLTQGLVLRETRRGRYEGDWTVPAVTSATRAVLMGHLRRNGLESVYQAERPVSLSAPAAVAPPAWKLQPPPGGQARTRPVVGAEADRPMSSLRLWVDSQEFTGQARKDKSSIEWRPAYDLAAGRHAAVVEARDAAGRAFRQEWSFEVAGGTEPPSGTVPLAVTSPAPGSQVPRKFEVRGQTLPGAKVEAEARVEGKGGKPARASTRADGQGFFQLKLSVKGGDRVQVTVVATDARGKSTPVRLDLLLR